LREQCAYEAIDEKYKSHWFIYVETLINQCVINTADTSNMVIVTPTCHDQVASLMSRKDFFILNDYPLIDFDYDKYKKCFKFQVDELEKNEGARYDSSTSKSFLDRDYMAKRVVGHTFHPSVSLNNITFKGDYKDPNVLFKKMCSLMSKRPKECKNLNMVDYKKEMIEQFRKKYGAKDSEQRAQYVQAELKR